LDFAIVGFFQKWYLSAALLVCQSSSVGHTPNGETHNLNRNGSAFCRNDDLKRQQQQQQAAASSIYPQQQQ
jgi:hypothetical protein